MTHNHFFPTGGTGGGDFGIGRLELVQHVPMVRENWVSRCAARRTVVSEDAVAPYTCCRRIGGGDTLRGYSERPGSAIGPPR